ncbi:MAG: hypothetical protein JKY61_04415 [Planctomycetes bacterium]|nr:hypothetical protein [Planctomycetota bacterium]
MSLAEVALQLDLVVRVEVVEIQTAGAKPVGFQGSPTILLGGMDVDPAARGKVKEGYG